ncbi:MAG: hypothetical protein ACRDIC_04305 [bacterium]
MRNGRVRAAPLVVALIALTIGLVDGAVWAEARSMAGVKVLAVAPFSDDNLNLRLAATRLGEILSNSGGRFQIIEPARVAEEMKRMGIRVSDLISPARTVALGERLGADAVLTGRMVQMSRGGAPAGEARVVIDVRVLEVSSRLKLFEQEISYSDVSNAMERAVDGWAREAAAMLTQ